MKTVKVYRNGSATFAGRIAKALAHFEIHNDKLPAAVIVNPRDEVAAKIVLADLALALPVLLDGGTLAGEVGLLVAKGEKR